MKKIQIPFIAAFLLLLSGISLGDVIITRDNMILNGKIIEEVDDEYVKLANYHGIFTIYYEQIKEIHRTKDYREDVAVFETMGKDVDESAVETNFQAGVEKLETEKKSRKKEQPPETPFMLSVSPFLFLHMGKIGTVLPYGYGMEILGEVPLQQGNAFLPGTTRAHLQYYHSARGDKKITSIRSSLGVAWKIPVTISGKLLYIALCPSMGAGYYRVQGSHEEAAGLKLHASFSAGPEIPLSSWKVLPAIQVQYVHDNTEPLYGPGFSLGIGYIF